MDSSSSTQDLIPDDISLKIASSLQVVDLCSLGSCSRFWWELCRSDYLWESLCKKRWPALALQIESSSYQNQPHEEWRVFYIRKHNEMAGKAGGIIDYVNRCLAFESNEVGHYLKAVRDLDSILFGFEDVHTFFLKSKHNVLLNLIGLHSCLIWLGLPGECVMEILNNCNILQRQVHVQWWKLGRWLFGFRFRDELITRSVSLEEIATGKEDEVLWMLHRGAVHEVIRAQISASKPENTSSHKTPTSKILCIMCASIVNISPKFLQKTRIIVDSRVKFTYYVPFYIYVVNNENSRGKEVCIECKFDDYRV